MTTEKVLRCISCARVIKAEEPRQPSMDGGVVCSDCSAPIIPDWKERNDARRDS